MTDDTPDPPALLSITEAARVLSCSRGHVYNIIAAGDLPVVDIGVKGRPKSRVRAADLTLYVDSRTRDGRTARSVDPSPYRPSSC